MKYGMTRGALALLYLALPALVAAAGVPVHYLVLEINQDGLIHPLFYQLVEVAAAPRSLSVEDLAEFFERERSTGNLVSFELRDRSGQVVFRNAAVLSEELRGEFHGESRPDGNWEIESHRFSPQRPVPFVIRVPALAGSHLVFDDVLRNEFDLAALARDSDSLPLAPLAFPDIQLGAIGPPGNSNNRVDLLIMGDGYTAGEMAKFNTDAATVVNDFFSVNGYSEYRNYVNVTTLVHASAQSGADHPPYDPACPPPVDNLACCVDVTAQADPLQGTYQDTAFDGRYCAFGVHRLAVVDNSKVFAAAAATPNWDKIFVILNDTTYGGSGGLIPVSSIHPLAIDVARHEYGHSFTGLADEYTTAFPSFPACSDLPGSVAPCEVNVTDETVRNMIKWGPWIKASTPVPTPLPSTEVGLFEGARYMTSGIYRPRDVCLMNILGVPFGEVCAQSYVLKLYQGGWGTPADGIDPIEPSSEVPPPGNVQMTAATQQFHVDVLAPIGGPPPQVTWSVGGVSAATNTDTFVFTPPGPGTFALRVEVDDQTPLVNSVMAGTSLQSAREWSVTTGAVCSPGVADSVELSTPQTGTVVHRACKTITAKSGFSVEPGAQVTLQAGESVVFEDGSSAGTTLSVLLTLP